MYTLFPLTVVENQIMFIVLYMDAWHKQFFVSNESKYVCGCMRVDVCVCGCIVPKPL